MRSSCKSQLDAATTKYQEALARQSADSTPGDARVISRAIAPILPTFPKKLPLMIFATLAGLVLSVSWIVSSELLSGRAFGPLAAEAGPQVPDIAPTRPLKRRRMILRRRRRNSSRPHPRTRHAGAARAWTRMA